MILELYAVLLAIAFFVVYLGFKYDNMYGVVGFFFIFLLSLVLVTNSLQYNTGATINTVNTTTTNIVHNYTNYTDSSSHWIGYFLAIASSFGMIFSWMKPNREDIRR